MTTIDYRLIEAIENISCTLEKICNILEIQCDRSNSLKKIDLTDVESYFESKEDDGK